MSGGGFRVKAELTGIKDLVGTLARLKKAVRNKLLRGAVGDGSKILLQAVKAKAPRESGLMRKSLGRRLKVYRNSGTVVGIVGPRTGFKREVSVGGRAGGRNPTKYAHLVEGGRRPVRIVNKKVLTDGGIFYGREVAAARAQPFMHEALAESGARVQAAVRQKLTDGIAEAARR
jgi:HK97 gp10 family phage protein